MSRPCSTDVWERMRPLHAPVLRALSLKASRWFKKLEQAEREKSQMTERMAERILAGTVA